jgi:vitamin B12 transporter
MSYPSRAFIAQCCLLFSMLSVSPATAASGGRTAAELEEVIVTASRRAEPIDKALASVSVVDRTAIEGRQYASFERLLSDLPGISITNNGGIGKASSIFIRGAESDHSLVLINGLRWGSTTLGTSSLQDLPLELIERVEVVRGPRSALYGADALGGVIQIFTRRPAADERLQREASVGVGSSGTQRAALNLGATIDRGFWQLGGSWTDSDGTNACRGFGAPQFVGCFTDEPDADGYRNASLTARAGAELGTSGLLEVSGSLTEGRVEFDGSFQNIAETRQSTLGGAYTHESADKTRIVAQFGRTSDDSDNYSEGTFVSRFDTARDSASLQADLALRPALTLTLGTDYLRDTVESTTAYTETARRNIAAFTALQGSLGSHSLQAGLRYDDNQRYGGETTASFGWGWDLSPQWRWVATAGDGFKAPSFNELYFPGFSNPALRPERSTSLETSLRWKTQNATAAISVYRNSIDDLIGFDASFTPANIDKTRIEGVELTARTSIGPWQLDGSAEWLSPINRSAGVDQGKTLPRRARNILRADVERRWQRGSVGVRTQYQGGRFDNLANTRALDSYLTLDLRAEWRISAALRLQARLDNMTDETYESASFYPQPGREWHIGIRYSAR